MAFATTDRMDGVPGGYTRPSPRGASRSSAAEGFDRILSAAGAREPQAADARRTGTSGSARDAAAQPPARAEARRDASDARSDAAARSQIAGRRADLMDDKRADAVTDKRADAAADGGADAAAGTSAATAADAPNAAKAEAVSAETVSPEGPAGSLPAPEAEPGADGAAPNGQAAAQIPQDVAAAQAAQAAQAGATAVQARPSTEAGTDAVAGKADETDGETEEAAADPAAPQALPAFLALLAAAPPPAGAGAAVPQAGGLPGATAQPGGAGAKAAGLAQVPGQVPGQVQGAALQGAQPQGFGEAAGAAGIPVNRTGGVQGAEDGKAESAVPTDAGAAKEAAAKPDLVAALAGAVAEPGTAVGQAAGQAPGHGLAQAAAQGIGQTAPAHAAAHAAGSAAASVPATPPVQIGQVPMTIGLRALSGSSQFEIRLDPLDLGRIDVKLEIDKERGTVMTHMVVERVETLAMLQRDANSLQQALSQAGLDAQDGGINLSLRGDGQSEGRTGDQAGGRDDRAPRNAWMPETERAAEAPLRMLHGLGSLGGLDIRI